MEISNTTRLEQLLKLTTALRDDKWEKEFLTLIPNLKLKLVYEEAKLGPDNWPYLFGELVSPEAEAEPLLKVLTWLSDKGIGLTINPKNSFPDFVLTYGMVWNYRERGEFLTYEEPTAIKSANGGEAKSEGDSKDNLKVKSELKPTEKLKEKLKENSLEIQHGEQLYVGTPSASFLPSYVRSILRQFWMDQGVLRPKITMLSKDQKNFDLCFSADSLGNPPQVEWQGIVEAMAWFLPAHYRIAVLPEKVVPSFEAL